MEAMRKGGGVAAVRHPVYGEFSLPRMPNERPIEFLSRFRGAYGAWYNEQEYKASSQARVAKASLGEANNGPSITGVPSTQVVQTPKTSLGETIKAQVVALRSEVSLVSDALAYYANQCDGAEHRKYKLERELELAEKFLKELEQDGSTPTISQEVGGDIHSQVGQRKSGISGGMGSPRSPEARSSEGEGADASDPFTGDYEDSAS